MIIGTSKQGKKLVKRKQEESLNIQKADIIE